MSVRGPNEALAAAEGGAHIADVEYPASALGTPYPLNIRAVRQRLDEAGFRGMPVSTNIGEEQPVRSTACQAALGVAVAGADYIKFGLAGFNLKSAIYLGRNVVRSVREWFPKCKVYPAVFPEEEFALSFDPLTDGPKLVEQIECDGLLIDTFRKDIGKGLLDYYDLNQLAAFAKTLRALGKEAWVAGSVTKDELAGLWGTGTDVICVRAAACTMNESYARFGSVDPQIVSGLVAAVPPAGSRQREGFRCG
ncbi:MAG: (5-formylfuran-3-yl)methyl phosphate synthase [Phycisphaerae bacterium]